MTVGSLVETITRNLARELRFFPQQRILFDHLPKCGGCSIGFFLTQNYPRRLVFRTNGTNPEESVQRFKTLSESRRWKYRLIIGHLTHELRDYVHPNTFKATVFRDPVDRIVSHYFYVKRNPTHYLHKRVVEENITLAEYTQKDLSSELTNWYTSHFSGMSPCAVSTAPSEAISTALKAVLESYDLIGFQDDIHGFLENIRATCRLTSSVSEDRKNVTDGRKSVKDLSEDEFMNISRSNAADIELFALIRNAVTNKTME